MTEKAKTKPTATNPQDQKAQLDRALADTFPASDPPQVVLRLPKADLPEKGGSKLRCNRCEPIPESAT